MKYGRATTDLRTGILYATSKTTELMN